MEMNVNVVLGVRAKRDPVIALGHLLSPMRSSLRCRADCINIPALKSLFGEFGSRERDSGRLLGCGASDVREALVTTAEGGFSFSALPQVG